MPIAMTDLSVREVIALYLRHLLRRRDSSDLSPQTYEDAYRDLMAFAEHHGDKPLLGCRKHDLTEWIETHPAWISNWTRRRIIGGIVRAFLWAEDEELIEASPYRLPKRMKRGRKRRPATHAEYIALMRGGSRPLRRAIFFLRRTGARTIEMRELVWKEIDFQNGVIVRETHKTIDQTEEPIPRVIGLDKPTLRFLKNLYRSRHLEEHVFTNCDGTPWDRHTFARHMNRWAARLGLDPTRAKLSPYCFRHSYGTDAIIAGVGERQLADQLGHTTTRMVAYYAHTAGKFEHLKRVAESALKRPKKN